MDLEAENVLLRQENYFFFSSSENIAIPLDFTSFGVDVERGGAADRAKELVVALFAVLCVTCEKKFLFYFFFTRLVIKASRFFSYLCC